jgi:hypothetical protein
VRFADCDVRVANLLADYRPDSDFTWLHERDFPVFVRRGSVKRSGKPKLDGVRKELAGGILGNCFELKFAADGGGSLHRSDFHGGDLGDFFRLFLLAGDTLSRGRKSKHAGSSEKKGNAKAEWRRRAQGTHKNSQKWGTE